MMDVLEKYEFKFDKDAVPVEHEQMHIYKSLFPDVMPSMKIIVHIDSGKDEDGQLLQAVLHAGYEAYRQEMKKRLNAKYGADTVGSWHTVPDPEIRD